MATNKDDGNKTKATLLDFFVRFDGVSSDPETYIYEVEDEADGLNVDMKVYQPGMTMRFAHANVHNARADVVVNNAQLLNLFAQTGMTFIQVDIVYGSEDSRSEEAYKTAVRGR